jgi:hypothetical protein
MTLVLLLVLAIDGTVVNKTTGQPVANANISLIKPSAQGMQPVGSVTTDAAGKFNLPGSTEGMTLLQATYEGVNYNKLLEPGAATTDIEVAVFSTSNKPQLAKASQHMILIEPVPGELRVRETIIYENQTKNTLIDPQGGTMRFFLPPMAGGKATVDASSGSRGMPLKRIAKPTGEANIYSVDFPLKPGETRFDITWKANFAAPGELNTRIRSRATASPSSPMNRARWLRCLLLRMVRSTSASKVPAR